MNNLALSDEILLKIEKPVRYIGNEVNMVRKDPEGKIRFAMCFPDVYEIGMSHLGMKIIYDQMNRRDDVYCERVFSPWVDLDKVMREENIPLFALESQDPVFMFDFLAVTIQYEMCYTNILQILDLSQIGIYAKDRREDAPFVIGGGILIAIAFLIDGFSVDLNSLPLDQRSNFGTITPMAAMFKSIGGVAFGFMLLILAGFIAMSIADRPGLAVGFVGGAIAANGTSGFLGALVAGFLAGYVVLLLKKICSKLPDSLEGTKPVLIYPLFGIFIVGVLMTYVVEPPIGALNTLINNGLNGLNGASAILLGALLGGMMSVDMGGPVNKAAYVFGTASIAAGNYNIMAAVMVGGMVPPIAIALATLIFKNKFTADERKAGPTNFIMGLSFITEGAIPFAASDPLHVLPACAVGSAAAGALSMAFNCTLMAPHGGIFVFLTVGNPLLYLVALAVGSAVGCVLLGVLKKKTA